MRLRSAPCGCVALLVLAVSACGPVPGIDVDAATSRSMPAVLALVQQRAAAGTLAPAVVLHMGDNGPIVAEPLDQVMNLVRCQRRVVLIDDKEPRAWEAGNNALLRAAARRSPNTTLVDWRGAATPHPEWFYGEGIHPAARRGDRLRAGGRRPLGRPAAEVRAGCSGSRGTGSRGRTAA